MKSALGYFLILVVFFCIAMFNYNKLIKDEQIIRIFDLGSIINNNKTL